MTRELGKFYFNEEYIDEYYNKRAEYNKLNKEVSDASKEIKDRMHKCGMIYASTDNYNIILQQIHEVSPEFIEILKQNNLDYLIKESCTMADYKAACLLLGINPELYSQIRQHNLKVNKK
ncbi:MAG: hypothetical protein ATN33_06905 [Epulopiscium sp. Nele67-Bin001]|nr:MAG: hypothetical protein BEN18_07650 [Epulopiscium sp. Nuni2H_MBin001]OON92643.1 MAG: hypothetical protein ATN33_06905 [Epulopiscium sp. Nele67-Bin001]